MSMQQGNKKKILKWYDSVDDDQRDHVLAKESCRREEKSCSILYVNASWCSDNSDNGYMACNVEVRVSK